MGIDTFVLGAQPVECLAVFVLHAFTPIRDANTVTFLRRIRVGAVLGLPRRAPQLYIVGMGPFDVVVFSEATIDQIVGGFVAFSMYGLDPRLCQAAIRAAGIDIDRDDHLVFRRRYDLHIVSGRHPPSAIFITRASASVVEARGGFCLATSFLLVFSRRSRSASSSFMRCCAAAIRAARSRAPRSFAARRTRSPAAGSVSTSARRRSTRAGGTNSPRHPHAPASHPAPTCRATPIQPRPSTRRPAPEAVPELPYGRSGRSTGCDNSSTPRRITSDRPHDRGTAGPVRGRCRPHRPSPTATAPTSASALPADVRAGPRAP